MDEEARQILGLSFRNGASRSEAGLILTSTSGTTSTKGAQNGVTVKKVVERDFSFVPTAENALSTHPRLCGFLTMTGKRNEPQVSGVI